MPTMNVNLTTEMAEFVASEIATGDYMSASELVRDALRTLRVERELEREKLALLRQEIDLALDQTQRGEFSDRSIMQIAGCVLQ